MEHRVDEQRAAAFRGAQPGEVGTGRVEGGVQAQGGQDVFQLAAPLRLKPGHPEQQPGVLRRPNQRREGAPVQVFQPGVQVPVGQDGREGQPPVVVGEHNPGGVFGAEVLLLPDAVGEKVGYRARPVGGVEAVLPGAVRVEPVGPGVFQIEGVDQQQGGVLRRHLCQYLGDHAAGVLLHPAVHRPPGLLGGEVGLIEPRIIEGGAPGEKQLVGLQAVVQPQGVGQIGHGAAAQIPILGQQGGGVGVDGVHIRPQQGLKLRQRVPGGAVGRHGQGQGNGQGGEQGAHPRLPHRPEQLGPQIADGGVRRPVGLRGRGRSRLNGLRQVGHLRR